jgi:hypothetical protein
MFLLVILGHLSIILPLIISYIKPEINMYVPMNIAFITIIVILVTNLNMMTNQHIEELKLFNKEETDFIKSTVKQTCLQKRIDTLGNVYSLFTLTVTFIPFIIIGLMYGLYIATTLYMLIRIFRMFIIYRHRNNLISLLQYSNYFNA